ncbi:MAG: excinuclease ABC subunit UvrC [Bryobacteraceae bacterium]|nr:excinuclease ABC subunit UvrC [Bryobacteraceae bacterium]
MDLRQRASQLPLSPGVYLYKDAAGTVLYVGKAKNLRNRVRSYFSDERLAERKTSSLICAASTIDYILVDNEKEALALENNLIKQYKPRYNVLLRDDKTYPYIKITNETWPRVYVTRRVRKDGASYFGPYFPGNLAHRLVRLIHRSFKIPSCKVDFSRTHSHPCLEYHINRCLGPCVAGLTTPAAYQSAVHDLRLFLEGRHRDLAADLRRRMAESSELMEFERAAALRDLLRTVEEVEEKQKMASASSDDTDIFSFHAEPPLVAVNLFHLRSGKIVDRREIFWEDLDEFSPDEFFTTLLMQLYGAGQPIPSTIHVPVELEDQDSLAELLSEKRNRRVEIHTPQRGQKRALLALVGSNARHSFEQRFRVLKPSSKAVAESLAAALQMDDPPTRIECFDISHTQGTDQVASMVVWENGRMKKSDYRKFIIKTVAGNDDFASMHEVVTRRYSRLQSEAAPMPSLVLIDGGLGQLHSAAAALESLGILNQPLASIAKREEILYVYGFEDEPVILDHTSPVLHLVQMIRDEAHRFAVTFHRTRRNARTLTSELLEIPGIGPKSMEKLLKHFGSLSQVKQASAEDLARIVGPAAAARLLESFSAQ